MDGIQVGGLGELGIVVQWRERERRDDERF